MHKTILSRIFLIICVLGWSVSETEGARGTGDSEPSGNGQQISAAAMDSLLEAATRELNAQRAVMLAEEALNTPMGIGMDLQKARAHHLAGLAWKLYGVPGKSLDRLEVALIMYRKLRMPHQEHVVLRDLAETYRAAFQHVRALEHLDTSLEYFRSLKDMEQLAYTYDRKGAVYFELLFDHPEFHLLDSISKGDPKAFQNNLPRFQELNQIYLNAKNNIDSAVVLAGQLNLIPVVISSGILKAAMYYLEQNVATAIRSYEHMIGIIERSGHVRELPLALINQARVYGVYRLNKPEKAITIARKALDLAIQYDIPIYEYLAYEVLHNNYLALGDYKMAYELLNKLRDLYARLEFDKMKMVVATQDFEVKLKEGEFEIRQRIILQHIVLLVSGIVVVFLSVIVMVIFLSKQKKNALLSELKQKNELVITQNEELQMVNAQKDRLISIIAHDLRNPFNSILGFSELLQEEVHSIEPADIRRYAGLIRSSAQQTLQLLTSLLEWSRFHEGRMDFSPEKQSLRSIVLEALQILLFQSKQKNINIHLEISGELIVMVDRTMVVTVLRNLISNALKFTHPGGDIWLEAKETKGEIQMEVRDNGNGMIASRLENLFKIDSWVTTPGTQGEMGSGFGLILTKEFIEKHQGRVWAESEENKGTSFFFSLPGA